MLADGPSYAAAAEPAYPPHIVEAHIFNRRLAVAQAMIGQPLESAAFIGATRDTCAVTLKEWHAVASEVINEVLQSVPVDEREDFRDELYEALASGPTLALELDFSADPLDAKDDDDADTNKKKKKPWYTRLKHWVQKKLGMRKKKNKSTEDDEGTSARPEFLSKRTHWTLDEQHKRTLIADVRRPLFPGNHPP